MNACGFSVCRKCQPLFKRAKEEDEDLMKRLGLIFMALACFVGSGIPFSAHAEKFPDHPITLIVPYQAGGATDIVIRPLAEGAKKYLGQSVLVENRTGGGGAVGVSAVVGKKPDGYILTVAFPSLHRLSYINKLSFDTVKDLTPIILYGGNLFGILVRAESPYRSLQDLLEYAKANPGKVSYMASGIGSGGHIAMEELATHAGGIVLSHVPSKGDAESNTALLGGHVEAISTTSGWLPLVEAGKLRLLATYGEKRTKRFTNVPTVKELGFNVIQTNPGWIFGPKGMPPEIVMILHEAFRKALDDPRFLDAMERYEMPHMYQNIEECTKTWADAYIQAGKHVKIYIK
jgi:tripartite-type tricarboxylate transporter receptor subunit TctC